MSGYIKYFDNGGKSMSYTIEDESMYLKYNEIGNKITYQACDFIVNLFMMRNT